MEKKVEYKTEEKGIYNSSEITELIKALCKAKKDFKPITKDGKNPFLNTKYVTLDGIINATENALNNNGLVIMHHQKFIEDTKYLVTELIHESGQIKSTETCMNEYITIQTNERGNAKVTPIQIFGSIITYLKRYHIGELLNVAVDEDVDGSKQEDNKDKGRDKPKTTLETLTAKYFKFASSNEVERHKWQTENIGKASTKNWTEEDFQKAINLLENKPKDHKPKSLEILKSNLDTIKTITELENKYKENKKAYESSEMKDSILSLFASRKRQLQKEILAESMGFTVFEIDSFFETLIKSDDMDSLIQEALAGNADAISQLKTHLTAFQISRNIDEMTQDEQELFEGQVEET